MNRNTLERADYLNNAFKKFKTALQPLINKFLKEYKNSAYWDVFETGTDDYDAWPVFDKIAELFKFKDFQDKIDNKLIDYVLHRKNDIDYFEYMERFKTIEEWIEFKMQVFVMDILIQLNHLVHQALKIEDQIKTSDSYLDAVLIDALKDKIILLINHKAEDEFIKLPLFEIY